MDGSHVALGVLWCNHGTMGRAAPNRLKAKERE
jgi:hypothetical protein